MKMCGIYLITHVESGRKYVGQSRDIHARWIEHGRGRGKTWLARAIRTHGWPEFHTAILELCEPDQLNDAEAKWIVALGTTSPAGFNLTSGGLYFMRSAETIARSAAFHTGRKRSPEVCANIGAAKRGTKHSAETKAKMSAAHIGRVVSQVTRDKLSALAKRQVWSAEARAKISAANAARVYTDAMRLRRSVAHLGNTLSAETRAKISAALQGKSRTPEERARLASLRVGIKLTPDEISQRTATLRANRLRLLTADL